MRCLPRFASLSLGRALLLATALAALVVAVDLGRWLVWPDVARLATENPGQTALMAWRAGQAARGRPARRQCVWTPLSRISRHLILAVTIAEDDKFWSHEGFDLAGMEDALRRNLARGEVRAGGSTITQQLAKNLYFTPERSWRRKAQEAVVAWRLERALGKRRILELYLNVVEWGDNVFGAEAAARRHFGISAAALGPAQAARLAAVLPSPLRWDPAGDSAVVAQRSAIILGRMALRQGAGH